MHISLRGAHAAAVLVLLAGCGGDDDAAAGTSGAAAGDTAALTVAEAPAAALDTAQAVAARGDTAAAAQNPAMPPAEARLPPERPAPPNPITPEEAQRYTLTMDRIRQLARAGEQLAELQRRNPALRDSMAVGAADPNAILERLSNVAEARSAVARAGLSPRDYTLSTMALLQAAMVSQVRQQGGNVPVPVNEDNVRVVTENWEEIQRMMRSTAERAGGN